MLEFSSSGSRVSLDVRSQRGRMGDTHYEVTVPVGVRLELKSVSGDITSHGVAVFHALTEAALTSALESKGLEYDLNEGDGAFYGPKIDLHMTDSLNRSWQLGTVQLDYNFPERFDLSYTGADNAEHRPVMIHRAMLGSMERFAGILVEHYGGRFPLWLAPTQAVVLPVADGGPCFASARSRTWRRCS